MIEQLPATANGLVRISGNPRPNHRGKVRCPSPSNPRRYSCKHNDDGNWKLTKTFDGSVGAYRPPADGAAILLREESKRLLTSLTKEQLAEQINILTEQLRELERQNTNLNGSIALQIARKLPLGKNVRKLLASNQEPLRKK